MTSAVSTKMEYSSMAADKEVMAFHEGKLEALGALIRDIKKHFPKGLDGSEGAIEELGQMEFACNRVGNVLRQHRAEDLKES
jgi:hypothetical protein